MSLALSWSHRSLVICSISCLKSLSLNLLFCLWLTSWKLSTSICVSGIDVMSPLWILIGSSSSELITWILENKELHELLYVIVSYNFISNNCVSDNQISNKVKTVLIAVNVAYLVISNNITLLFVADNYVSNNRHTKINLCTDMISVVDLVIGNNITLLFVANNYVSFNYITIMNWT